jgi:hypothetical protein
MSRRAIADLNDGCSVLLRYRLLTGSSQDHVASSFRVRVDLVQAWERGITPVPEGVLSVLSCWTGLLSENLELLQDADHTRH